MREESQILSCRGVGSRAGAQETDLKLSLASTIRNEGGKPNIELSRGRFAGWGPGNGP